MKKLNESSVMNTKEETLANTARLLRQCSYDPAPDRILVNYGQGGQDELYLEVKFRMLWFLTWCKENGFNGFIDESEYEVIPSMGMVIAKAKVYVDGNLIGAAAASAVTNGDYAHNEKLIQTAATSAKVKLSLLTQESKSSATRSILLSTRRLLFRQKKPRKKRLLKSRRSAPDGKRPRLRLKKPYRSLRKNSLPKSRPPKNRQSLRKQNPWQKLLSRKTLSPLLSLQQKPLRSIR